MSSLSGGVAAQLPESAVHQVQCGSMFFRSTGLIRVSGTAGRVRRRRRWAMYAAYRFTGDVGQQDVAGEHLGTEHRRDVFRGDPSDRNSSTCPEGGCGRSTDVADAAPNARVLAGGWITTTGPWRASGTVPWRKSRGCLPSWGSRTSRSTLLVRRIRAPWYAEVVDLPFPTVGQHRQATGHSPCPSPQPNPVLPSPGRSASQLR